MQPHPTTLVGTTPRTVEAAFRVLARGGKARALLIARAGVELLAEAELPPSDAIGRLIGQIEKAEHDDQVVGPLEAIGVRLVERFKAKLAASKKDGIDLARALEERILPQEKALAAEAKQELEERLAQEKAEADRKKAADEAAKAEQAQVEEARLRREAKAAAEAKATKASAKTGGAPPAPGA